jgi:uncharacterized membrane protein YcjF (UPF0283 family)
MHQLAVLIAARRLVHDVHQASGWTSSGPCANVAVLVVAVAVEVGWSHIDLAPLDVRLAMSLNQPPRLASDVAPGRLVNAHKIT